MSQALLRMVNINKKISDYFSLKNINLSLLEGEVHILAGENGSGKTSLMKVLLGAYPKDKGEIIIDGRAVQINSPTDAKKCGIAMIHQESSLFEHFSVAENIYMDSKPLLNKFFRIIDWSKMHQQCQALFEKLNLDIDSKALVKHLGVATKQMVEIAKAYISNARIIIMDEPTSALTENELSLLFKIIRELKNSGVSIFYISHRLEEIEEIGDRITVIRDGEIVGTQDVKDMDAGDIIHMMAGMELTEKYPKLKVRAGREKLRVTNLYSGDILKGITFSLREREIIGITGLMGSGRTKIAKTLFGIDSYDSGEIAIDRVPVRFNSPIDAIRAGLGYVTEDKYADGLFMCLGIPQNITSTSVVSVFKNFIVNLSREREIASEYIYKLGIKTGSVTEKAAYLSGGNQQKVVLAKWMLTNAKIFILDEPTKGIDIASKVDVYNLMNEMVRKGASIIFISSDIDEIIGMCDRVLVLYGGRIVADIPRSEATTKKIMFYATGGRD
ncbi:MAG: sugar ABC transporter ATP-binding protein [Bacillota bacterium]